jgi:hypothetical protein
MPTDIPPLSRSRSSSPLDEPEGAGASSTGGATRDASTTPCSTHDDHRDRAILDACRNAPPAAWNPAPRTPSNDAVLYMGMNKDSFGIESRALAARGARLSTIESSASSTVSFEGHDYDLSSEMGSRIFAAAVARTYGLDREHTIALGDALAGTDPRGRDELARIALAWAPAESGATIPSRMILSGHSTGGLLMGGHGGSELRFDDVLALARSMPAAARQIEDIHLSGCFTQQQVNQPAKWTAVFPNLKTLWGYGGFAPAAPIGHLSDWESATRGRTDQLGERFMAAHGTATAWSLRGGIANAGSSLEERRDLVADVDRDFAAFFSGDRPINEPHQADADRAYGAYRTLSAHSGATAAERATSSQRADQMLRLRFYEHGVRTEFSEKYGGLVSRAFERLGLPHANLGTLSRKEALAAIADFTERAAGQSDPDVARAARALDALAKLDPTVIEAGWCHE